MDGKLHAQINEAEKLLRKLGLLLDSNPWVSYSKDLPATVRDMSYVDEYRTYVNQRLFDFYLVDHGLVQFKWHDQDDISYCYYQSPFDVPTYEEYVADQLQDWDLDIKAEVGDIFLDDYEKLIDTARLRKGVTPIRYDYTPDQYQEGIHPAAHIHIGSGNDIRLHTRRVMLPMSFVLFILRQMYPDAWRQLLEASEIERILRAVRDDLQFVHNKYVGARDACQLILD